MMESLVEWNLIESEHQGDGPRPKMNTHFSNPQRGSHRPPEHPAKSRLPGTSAPTQRTRVETQYRPPLPSNRPPVFTRYTTSGEAPRPAAPSRPPHRSTGSSGRVYSSPDRTFNRCQSPVMTLRILSPSRESGSRADKKQDDQESRLAHGGSAENAPPSSGLRRSTNSKLVCPKRPRLQLRDSILLTRKDSAESSNGATSTDAGTPRESPAPLRQQRAPSETSEMSSMPSTPSRSRIPDLPRYAAEERESLLMSHANPILPARLGLRPRDHPPNIPQPPTPPARLPPTPPARLPPRELSLDSRQVTVKNSANSPRPVAEKPLVSRICSMILDEEFGAGADRSSTPLKVWETVVRCLDDVSQLAPPAAARKQGERSSPEHQAPEQRPPLESYDTAICNAGVAGVADDKASDASLEAKVAELEDRPAPGHSTLFQPPSGHSRSHALPCPYRLRNPTRFNVTDKWQCATGKWKSLDELQAHIVKEHKHSGDAQLFQCPRCEKGFSEPAAFRNHMMLPKDKMCDPTSQEPSTGGDVEDGLTDARARDLSDRVKNETLRSWDELWRWLFPTDKVAPRPVILPAVELPQVEQKVFASSCMSSLKASLEERLRLLALQSANDDSFSAQIPFITGSLALVVEAHLRSVFIACRNEPPSTSRKVSSKTTTTKDSPTGRPRNFSLSSTSSARSVDRLDHRGLAIGLHPTQGTAAKDTSRVPINRKRDNSNGTRPVKSLRAVTAPVSTMLTVPFPRISTLTELSDVGPNLLSEDWDRSPKGLATDAEYSSGVDSSPGSDSSFRQSTPTDIRCSKCNMRPSLRPDEDIFTGGGGCGIGRGRQSMAQAQARDPTCRFSDSGIGILCKSCRMLEELINSYSRTSSPSKSAKRRSGVTGKGARETEMEGPAATVAAAAAAAEAEMAADTETAVPLFSPDSSGTIDESEEETLFDLILDSATYLDEEGNRKTEIVTSMFPLPPVGFSNYGRFGQDDNFF
ncbi:hypothetical protein CGRA01v4_04075 [Colletotrichum graminicola]|nr:hypothetical protein CGRA01v4_04075 [Colletotrichum graminicola]